MPPEDQIPQGDSTPEGGTSVPADEIKNLKAEFSRKMDNLAAANAQLMQQLQTIVKPHQQAQTQPSAEPEFDKLWFDNPGKAAQLIEERAEKRINDRLAKQAEVTRKQNEVVSALVQEFPQLQNPSSDLAKEALKIYQSYGEDERNNPASYRAAVNEAALKKGVKPRSMGGEEDEAFSMGGSRSGSTGGKAPKKGELDERVSLAAQLLGLDVNDQATKKSLAKRQTRENWIKYSAPEKD
jgi:hypothetical protein